MNFLRILQFINIVYNFLPEFSFQSLYYIYVLLKDLVVTSFILIGFISSIIGFLLKNIFIISKSIFNFSSSLYLMKKYNKGILIFKYEIKSS